MSGEAHGQKDEFPNGLIVVLGPFREAVAEDFRSSIEGAPVLAPETIDSLHLSDSFLPYCQVLYTHRIPDHDRVGSTELRTWGEQFLGSVPELTPAAKMTFAPTADAKGAILGLQWPHGIDGEQLVGYVSALERCYHAITNVSHIVTTGTAPAEDSSNPCCDICSKPGQGTRISVSQMRHAVFESKFDPFALGLFPREFMIATDPGRAYQGWLPMVQENQTDWNLCARCYEGIQSYLPDGSLTVSASAASQTLSASGDKELCFVCATRPADQRHPIVISLKKEGQFTRLAVPACSVCGQKEAGAERKANGCALFAMLLPIILGAIWAGWQGALLGLGLGFFGGIAMQAFGTGRGRARQHPAIKALEEEGWHYNHLFVS